MVQDHDLWAKNDRSNPRLKISQEVTPGNVGRDDGLLSHMGRCDSLCYFFRRSKCLELLKNFGICVRHSLFFSP